MTRVAFVCDSDTWGGAEVYLTHLLRRAASEGWAASLVCAVPVAAGFTGLLPPGRLTVVPLARHAVDAPAIRGALALQRPDVVVVNLVDPGSNAAAVAAALAVAPTVGVLHLDGDLGDGRSRANLAALYLGMAAVLTPCSPARDHLTAGLGLPPDRVHVVPNGVDVPRLPAGPAGRTVPRVGGLGRLTAQKGVDVLLGAARLLVAGGRAPEGVVGGGGGGGGGPRRPAGGPPGGLCGVVGGGPGFPAGPGVF